MPQPPVSLADQKIEAEIKKIQSETTLTEEKIVTEKNQREESVVEQIKNFLPIIVTIISIGAAAWALWDSISKYFDYKAAEEVRKVKEAEFQYNDKMVALVSGLDDEKTSEKSVMLLKYFGRDAIPILLYKLEHTPKLSNPKVVQAIAEIYEKDTTVFNRIIYDATNAFKRENLKESGDQIDLNTLENYLDLLGTMKIMNGFHRRQVISKLDVFKTIVNSIKDDDAKAGLLSSINKVVRIHEQTI